MVAKEGVNCFRGISRCIGNSNRTAPTRRTSRETRPESYFVSGLEFCCTDSRYHVLKLALGPSYQDFSVVGASPHAAAARPKFSQQADR